MKQDKKKQMKQKNNPAQILKDKKDKLDWQNFNFLENMLVFGTMRTMPGRNAPPESGIHFRITLDSQNKAICILLMRSSLLFKCRMLLNNYGVLIKQIFINLS